jgi:broad specificity phosphatase PhoE
MVSERSFALVRHGQTDYNLARRLNGDPSVPIPLNATGLAQVEELRPRVAALPIDLGVCTRFPRARQTKAILLEGRDVPREICADLDDVALGDFEGAPVTDYRAWRDENGPVGRPPGGGESRIDALTRYVRGFEWVLGHDARFPLIVTHDIPIRFLRNAIAGDDPISGPIRSIDNASLAVVTQAEMLRGLAVMRERLPTAAT